MISSCLLPTLKLTGTCDSQMRSKIFFFFFLQNLLTDSRKEFATFRNGQSKTETENWCN